MKEKKSIVVIEKKEDFPENTFFKINEASKLIGVHQQTLRNWERKNLLVPSRAGKLRIYTKKDIELGKIIKQYAGKGIPLKGIKELLKLKS